MGRIAEVQQRHPHGKFQRDDRPVRELPARLSVSEEIDWWGDEDLRPQLRATFIAPAQCDKRGQIGAGTFPGNRYPLRITAELGDVVGGPAYRRDGVVGGRGERMLGGEAVGRRDDNSTNTTREGCAGFVVKVEAAADPAAAVVEDHHRQGTL